jgi:hypothetical protein
VWLDQPDAHDRIDARGATGEISPEQASQLHGFVDNGIFDALPRTIARALRAYKNVRATVGALFLERRRRSSSATALAAWTIPST